MVNFLLYSSDNILSQDSAPRIHIAPSITLLDEPVQIFLLNFSPDQQIALQATWRISPDQVFRAMATFKSDNHGNVDLSKQQPLTGTYQAIDPMGLFWSMRLIDEADETFSGSENPLSPITIDLTARVNETIVATAKLTKLLVSPHVTWHAVDENGLAGTLFLPSSNDPAPGLLCIGGSDGRVPLQQAAMFASHGYVAFALACFGIGSLPNELVAVPLEYFEDATKWLQNHNAVAKNPIGAVGYSRGGELALLLGATIPQIRTVISYVGSGYTHGGIESASAVDKAAWTYQGKPLPVYNKDVPEEAIIQVEHINGPVLLISGQDDQVWSSSELSEAALKRLQVYEHPFYDQHLSYEGAGHTIGIPYLPTTMTEFVFPGSDQRFSFGGNPADIAFANVNSWHHVLGLLKMGFRE